MRSADFPTLETERLILRLPQAGDLDGWAALMSNETATLYLGGPIPRPVTWRLMASGAGSWVLQGFGVWSMIEKASGRWVGWVGPWRPEGWPGAEVAWSLSPGAWGKGYATEGGRAAIDFAFDGLGWSEVIHSIHPENLASQAVARRLGSTMRGPGKLPAPNEHSVVDLWGQTREQWLARGNLTGM